MHIKEAREKSGMSQQALADALNITQGAISQWEKGDSAPRANKLVQLAQILGCTVDELLRG
jgi:transcriptional regulator with XRE-family HTH domain